MWCYHNHQCRFITSYDMMPDRYARMVSWGKYVPSNVVTNDDLAQHMDTSDEWIQSRSGIRERRWAEEGETTATMSVAAGEAALERAGLSPEALDLILVATSSPDHLTPPVSSQVQDQLGAGPVPAMQLTVGCTGFVYALVTAQQFIQNGTSDRVLVLGTELTSRWMSYENRSTAVLFGDGAGAVVLEATDEPCGIEGHILASDGSGADDIKVPAGGVAIPPTHDAIDAGLCNLKMNGREVFKFATRVMGSALTDLLDEAGLQVEDIDLFVPHQANIRIINYAAEQAGLPKDKVMVNVDKYGNTSAASVPLALAEAFEEGRVQPGDRVALVAFGSGLTWGSALVKLSTAMPALEAVSGRATTKAQEPSPAA